MWDGERVCPTCGLGEYGYTDHDGWREPGLYGDEGQPVSFCPYCDEELTVDNVIPAEDFGPKPGFVVVALPGLPDCDLCTRPRKADFDARVKIDGRIGWANVCATHMRQHGIGGLGVGVGQRLIERASA